MLKHIQPYPKYSHIPKQFKPRIPQYNPTYHRSPLYIPNNSYSLPQNILQPYFNVFNSSVHLQKVAKVPSIFVLPYPILLTSYVQYSYNPAVKKWLQFELICAVFVRAHFGYRQTQGLSK